MREKSGRNLGKSEKMLTFTSTFEGEGSLSTWRKAENAESVYVSEYAEVVPTTTRMSV